MSCEKATLGYVVLKREKSCCFKLAIPSKLEVRYDAFCIDLKRNKNSGIASEYGCRQLGIINRDLLVIPMR